MKALKILLDEREQHLDIFEQNKELGNPNEDSYIIVLNEAIKELEDLQNRKCENCKFGKERYWDWDSGRFPFEKSFECKKLDKSGQLTPYSIYEEHKFYCSPNFYCNSYEPKESKWKHSQ